MNIDEMQNDYDWKEAFITCGENVCNVKEIYAFWIGYNDGDPWECIGKMYDKYFVLSAWCDYTGWDCRAGGQIHFYDTIDEAISNKALSTCQIGRMDNQILKYGLIPDWKYS